MKYKEISKLGKKELDEKLKELKMELVKSGTNASKQSGSKTKEIKKIIARIHTFNASKQEELKNN